MEWYSDLIVPTYVFGLSLVGVAARGVWSVIRRLTKVENSVDRLEEKVDDLVRDLRRHMDEEGSNISRLEALIRETRPKDPPT
jgi:hypothetical protein